MSFRLTIVYVGKPATIYSEAVDHYQKLTAPYVPVELAMVKPLSARISDVRTVIERESESLMKRWPGSAHSVALSPEGRVRTTEAFSEWLRKRREAGVPLVFTIGGAFGLSAALKSHAHETLSLSPLTMCHSLALVVLMEQIFRASTILSGHPYHK